MSHQSASIYRYCIQSVEVQLPNEVNDKASSRLLVDGQVVYELHPINKDHLFIWKGPFYCDVKATSTIDVQIYDGLELKSSVRFPALEFSSKCLIQLIKHWDSQYCASLSFLHPPSALDTQPASTALEAILNSVRELEASTMASQDKTPYTGIAVAARISCYAACQALRKKSEINSDVETLIVSFANTLDDMRLGDACHCSTSLGDAIAGVLKLVQRFAEFIVECSTMELLDDQAKRTLVTSTRKRVQNLLEELVSLNQGLRQELVKYMPHDCKLKIAWRRMKPVVRSGYFNSSECLPGTCTAVMNDFKKWIEGTSRTDRFLWIYGASGIGKTTVATSICKWLETRDMLGASFFCKWDDPDLRDPKRVILTVAYELSRRHEAYRQLLAAASCDPKFHMRSLHMLYECLLQSPVMKLAALEESTPKDTYIVVDGLNEFSWVKVVVTSQPGTEMGHFFDSVCDTSLKRMDLAQYNNQTDIHSLIRAHITPESGKLVQLDTPAILLLAERAGGLFIWVNVAFRFLGDGQDPAPRLRKIFDIPATNASSQIDQLYLLILEHATVGLNKADLDAFKFCLGVLIATSFNAPLPVENLRRLLSSYSHLDVFDMLVSLKPLLYEDLDVRGKGTLRVYHQSFVDFITMKSRAKDFYVDLKAFGPPLSTCCLSTMIAELGFNMCGLETASTLNCDILDFDSRVSLRIEPHLSYSCQYWISHVVASDPVHLDTGLLNEHILGKTFFYWIESLSLLGKLDIALSTLLTLRAWSCRNLIPDKISEYAHHAYRFVTRFYDPISESTPHLYVSALAFAPMSCLVATAARQSLSNRFRVAEGAAQHWPRCLKTLLHAGSVPCLALSPNGSTIVSGSTDHKLYLWDVETATRVNQPFTGHSDCVWSVAFSPDGRSVASGSHDTSVRLWDVQTGNEVFEPLNGHSGPVLSVSPSPGGQYIVSSSHDKTVRIWSTETGIEAFEPLLGHSGRVMCAIFSPDGSQIVSGSVDRTLCVWDVENWRSTRLRGHTSWIGSVSFSPDGSRIASGSYDHSIMVWDTKKHRSTIKSIGHSGPVNCVSFSPDGHSLVSSSSDHTVRFWDAQTGSEILSPLEGHHNVVLSVAWLPSGRVASSSMDMTLRIWDVIPCAGANHPASVQSGAIPKLGSVYSVSFSPDGQFVASGSSDRAVRIWHANTGILLLPPLVGHSKAVCSVAFSPDGQRVVSGSADNTILVWNIATGDAVFAPLIGHARGVSSVALSPDGSRIASGSWDRSVRVWDASTGLSIFTPHLDHHGTVHDVAFSWDGKRVISASEDNTIRMWDVEDSTSASILLVLDSSQVTSIAFSPSGQRIVSGSDEGALKIWDSETGIEVIAPLLGHSSTVCSVVFSPDGRRIASGSDDCTIRVWDAETGVPLSSPLVGHRKNVTSVAFSPDGRYVASGSEDNTIRIWSAEGLSTLDPPAHVSGTHLPLRPDGEWVSLRDNALWFWIPRDLPRLLGPPDVRDNSLIQIHNSSVPILDYSTFPHGADWTTAFIDQS